MLLGQPNPKVKIRKRFPNSVSVQKCNFLQFCSMNSFLQKSRSVLHHWNKPLQNNRYIRSRNGAIENVQRARSQSFGLVIGPDEIEIDLKMKNSQMIFEHLAALCGDMKMSNTHTRNEDMYDTQIGDHPRNGGKNSRSKSNLSQKICKSTDDQKYKTFISRDRNDKTSSNRSDQEYKTPSKRCTIWPSSSNFSLQSYIEKQTSNKERNKKLKKEIRSLRRICEKKGKKFVKDFEMKEKLRRKTDQMKYNSLKKNLQQEINEQKRVAKHKLKRQREKIKLKNKEEQSNLRMLKEKIKKKCESLKYYVEDECLD